MPLRFALCFCGLVFGMIAGCQSLRSRDPRPAAPVPRPAYPSQGQTRPSAERPQPRAASAPAAGRDRLASRSPDTTSDNLVIRATAPAGKESKGTGSPVPDRKPTPPDVVPASPTRTQPENGSQTDDLARITELYEQAAARYAQIDDFVLRLRRREVVNGERHPEQAVVMKFKKNPDSIYFKWLPGSPCEGRELIYVRGRYNNRLQVKTGKRDLIAGIRIELDPGSRRAMANTRRRVDEAGFGYLLDRFAAMVADQRSGGHRFGSLQYLGPQTRPESAAPMECVLQEIPSGIERHLPQGGRRFWFFNKDPRTQECHLPVLIVTLDHLDREVEYYHFDRMNANVGLRDADFDPDALWGKR